MAKMLLESDPDLCNQEGDVAKNDCQVQRPCFIMMFMLNSMLS